MKLSDVLATEQVSSLFDEIMEVCDDEEGDVVIDALWFTLIGVIMQVHGCSFQQALKSVRDMAKKISRYQDVLSVGPLH